MAKALSPNDFLERSEEIEQEIIDDLVEQINKDLTVQTFRLFLYGSAVIPVVISTEFGQRWDRYYREVIKCFTDAGWYIGPEDFKRPEQRQFILYLSEEDYQQSQSRRK